MAKKSELRPKNRPIRVKLGGSVLALVRLQNRREVRASLHQISVTGGVLHLESPLDEKVSVDLIFHIGSATLRSKAEMLFPMWATKGWLQPFRFKDLGEANLQTLEAALQALVKQFGECDDAAAAAAASE